MPGAEAMTEAASFSPVLSNWTKILAGVGDDVGVGQDSLAGNHDARARRLGR